MLIEVAWRLLGVLVLVGANAFFVAAEFSLVSAQDARLSGLEAKGDRLARLVRGAQKDLNLHLSSCQVGITLASLGLGWIGEPAIAQTLESVFSGLPSPADVIARHGVAVAIAFAVISMLHLVLGELAPKALAIFHPETVARWTIVPLIVFTRIGTPFIWSVNEIANLVLRAFGVRQVTEAERVHGREEIMLLVQRSSELGKVDVDERSMISGIFDLTRTVAREVMTPRPDIVATPVDAGFEELVDLGKNSGFSRLPVYGDNLDNVVGIVLVKDLLSLIGSGKTLQFDVRTIMREPYFVPDTKQVGDLLAEFRRLKIHMAIVVDEFGGTDGLVTLEDLLEEIVGEIYDEYDTARPMFIKTTRGDLVDGSAPVDEVNERFGLSLSVEEYDTLGGFILGELGHVPKPGDRIEVADTTLIVEDVHERRVRLVRIVSEAPARVVRSTGTAAGTDNPESES